MSYLMIVDDDEDFAVAIAVPLRRDGYEVGIELSPECALKAMQVRAPDLVILDVMFPEDSAAGFGMARAMRTQHPSLSRVPILVLSAVNARFPLGFSRKDIHEEWLPVQDIIDKPVAMDVLCGRVSELLAKTEREAEDFGQEQGMA